MRQRIRHRGSGRFSGQSGSSGLGLGGKRPVAFDPKRTSVSEYQHDIGAQFRYNLTGSAQASRLAPFWEH